MHRGQVIRGRFEIEKRIAIGGMGQIFRAKDLTSGHFVALKVMLDDESSHVRRFIREASLLSDLRHPGIVKHIADGMTDTGDPYLVMEWLEGEDLSDRLKRGPLEIHETLVLIEHVGNALAVAHERGIVHRDLKPSNLFLVNKDISLVKVLDFGIAALSGATPLTRSGVMIGTPSYMAPEQIRDTSGEGVDARTDVFALGCVLMECLTGVRVYNGDHPFAVMAKILMEPPPRLREVRPGIPRELDTFVLQMMSKDPNGRPKDGAAVAATLAKIRAQNLPMEMTLTLPPPASLTEEEQRILSLILVGRERPDGEAPTLAPSAWSDAQAELQRLAAMHGAVFTSLPDGSALVTIEDNPAGSEQTAQLAYCALAMKAVAADRPIALGTGRGKLRGKLPVGAVIDRAAQMVIECNTAELLASVVIDETSAHLLDGRFDVGRVESAYTLKGVRVSGVRTLLGKTTAFVGRDAELESLDEHLQQCLDEQVATAILVTGTAGMGKSRLLHEFLYGVHRRIPDIDVWIGRGDLLAAGSALALLSHALRGVFGLQEGAPLEDRQRKIRDRVARHASSNDGYRISEFIGEMIGAGFPDTDSPALRAARQDARLMSEQLLQAFEDFLNAETTHHPVLLVFEDLQWGDLPTVRFVDAALRHLSNRPLLVLALARPEVKEVFPTLWSGRSVNEIRLQPLSRKASERLIVQALSQNVTPESLADLVARAEGNAFYLEELIRAVADRATKGKTDLPDTVLAMVQSRLHALPAETRRCLRAASVFGAFFFESALAMLLGLTVQTQAFRCAVDDLVTRELIQRQSQSRFTGEVELVFRHALIRDSAYAMLTESDRQLGHRLVGTWLEEHHEPDAVLLAHHFERSDEPLRSVGAYRRAAEQALGADDLDAAIERAERGVLLGATGEELGALRLIQAEAHNWRGELALSEQQATAAVGLFVPGTTFWFRAFQQAFDAAGREGAFERMDAWTNLVRSAKPADDTLNSRTICLTVCANHFIHGGRYAAADALIAELPTTAVLATQGAQTLAMVQQLRAIRASAAGEPWLLRTFLEDALEAFDEAGDRRSACLTRQNLGFALAELGDYEGAERALRAALVYAEKSGLHEAAAAAMQNLGYVLANRGMFDEGRKLLSMAIDAARQRGHQRMEGLSRVSLAELERLSGDVAAAEGEARAAIDALSNVPPSLVLASAILARVLLARGHAGEALVTAREAYTLLESLGTIEEGEAMVRLVYAEALTANGDAAESARVLMLARRHVVAKAEKIQDAIERDRFLTAIADNARTLMLAARAED